MLPEGSVITSTLCDIYVCDTFYVNVNCDIATCEIRIYLVSKTNAEMSLQFQDSP